LVGGHTALSQLTALALGLLLQLLKQAPALTVLHAQNVLHALEAVTAAAPVQLQAHLEQSLVLKEQVLKLATSGQEVETPRLLLLTIKTVWMLVLLRSLHVRLEHAVVRLEHADVAPVLTRGKIIFLKTTLEHAYLRQAQTEQIVGTIL
jgi:hypothetical protein